MKKDKLHDRQQALRILTALYEEQKPLSLLFKINGDLSPFCKELCFGVARYFFQLQAIANSLLHKPIKINKIWLTILIGLYQLHFLRTKDYAAVKETVALLEMEHCHWAKGLVNAILRRYCREQQAITDALADNLFWQYNHPMWFVERIKKSWPQHWLNILAANDTHPPMTLRVNNKLIATQDYHTMLTKADISATMLRDSPAAVVLEQALPVEKIPGFNTGLFSVQDEAAQFAAPLLDLAPNMRVLDACAAPGGKTCHILATQPNIEMIALDNDGKRLNMVQDNLTRLNLTATLVQGDGCTPKKWWDGKPFDRILLDAPCSATGVIRRQPDIKLLRTPQEVTQISTLQATLLQKLWPLLAPGGIMLYATCSILPEENDLQIARFCSSHSDCTVLQDHKPWGHWTGHGWQILPGDQNRDGFFYSKLQKKK